MNITTIQGKFQDIIKGSKDDSVVIVKDLDVFKNKRKINNIPVFCVREIKGLEFDNVFVVTESMNRNEKYIAYTRALKKLFVSSDFYGLKYTANN